ncbi:hypothetical protein CHARACLAT_018857 [Characodon lateralis]|uniref:Uncharacterized protein n=1 Tax=Characodon lateralis TaxID=208331 RepID=A0ABU7F452_9TELE|nr:hypothetical protein [Characodon lateralis]
MAHPAQQNAPFLPTVTIAEVSVKYHGKASHDSAYPWEGVNALDAAVLAYSNLSVLRQQLKPEWRLHGIIKYGGLRLASELLLWSEARSGGDNLPGPYLYESNGKALGMVFPEQPASQLLWFRNLGNVSFIVPGIHPFFYIGTDALNHTEEYAEAAGAPEAQLHTLRAAKVLAVTAVDVVCCPDLLQQVRDDFRLTKLRGEETRGQKHNSERHMNTLDLTEFRG